MTGATSILHNVGFSALAVVLVLAGYVLSRFFSDKRLQEARLKSKELLEKAHIEIDSKLKEAEIKSRDMLIQVRENFERETKDRREEITVAEKRILQKEENVEKRLDLLEKKEKDVEVRVVKIHQEEAGLEEKHKQLGSLVEEEKQRLQKISSMTVEEARSLLLSRLDQELLGEKASRLRAVEEEIKESADKKAKEIISSAIHRCA
ncbi:MAG: Rnase Y domain-containing protein, partial [Candidatus Omnitrophota bacterium]